MRPGTPVSAVPGPPPHRGGRPGSAAGDVTRLRVIDALARHGSVTAAAKELHYTQPTVSHHLARLEVETGAQLLQRAGRGVRLTPAGRLLADRAAEMIGRLDAAEAELSAHVGLTAGRVRLATAVAPAHLRGDLRRPTRPARHHGGAGRTHRGRGSGEQCPAHPHDVGGSARSQPRATRPASLPGARRRASGNATLRHA